MVSLICDMLSKFQIQNYFSASIPVIYDNTITNGFIKTIIKLFKNYPLKSFFVALEKRFVFTDSVCAPMYEYFLENFKTEGLLKITEVPTTFPQYFEYDRCKELILLEVTRI